MRYRARNKNSASICGSSRAGQQRARNQHGGILPWFVLSLAVIIAFLAFTCDVMRTVHAISLLQFASQSAALASYRALFTADGTLRSGDATQNIFQYLQTTNAAQPWNNAPAGPANGVAQTPVQFNLSDIAIIQNNGNNPSDFLIQLQATRNGNDGLQLFFLPAIYAFNSLTGIPVPANTQKANPYRVTEVMAQPATRVGPGPALGSSGQNSQFIGCAAFPMAICNATTGNTNFLAASQAAKTNYTVDILPAGGKGSKQDLEGALVNLTASGSSSGNYYGAGQGIAAVNQLINSISYFQGNVQTSMAPANVERGSMLTAFNIADPSFQQQQGTIINQLNQLAKTNRYCIMPVLARDAVPNQLNQVIGFARARILSAVANGQNITVNIALGASAPMTNATIGTGFATIPSLNGQAVPTAVQPFVPRSYDLGNNSVSPPPFGVVMAPALSPRQIQGGLL